MAVPEKALPPLSEYQCRICLEILVEPVTLPCGHTLCKKCFQSIIEKSNLCCPFCRFWISSWTRYHTRRNSLVNMELWKKIQKHYPKECKLRVSCQESKDIDDDFKTVHLLSEPGELRKEYEEEKRKMEAVKRANEEEENKASEEYIQKLLAEEEKGRETQENTRKKEIEGQLKTDEELARNLSFHINNSSYLASPIKTRSQRKSENKKTDTGDVQEYLSPKSQVRLISLSPVVQGEKIFMSKETESNDIKSPERQDTKIETDTPTLSSQICLEIQKQGTKSSIESPMPQLCASGTGSRLERKVKVRPNKFDREICVTIDKEPTVTVPYCTEASVEPCVETESEYTVLDMAQMTGYYTAETQSEESEVYILVSKEDISKRKKQKFFFERVRDP